VIGSSPERFGEYLKMETARWTQIISDANIKGE
jgi:hypothetical protein